MVGFTLNIGGCATVLYDAILRTEERAFVEIVTEGVVAELVGNGEIEPTGILDIGIGHDVPLTVGGAGQSAQKVVGSAGADGAVLYALTFHDL